MLLTMVLYHLSPSRTPPCKSGLLIPVCLISMMSVCHAIISLSSHSWTMRGLWGSYGRAPGDSFSAWRSFKCLLNTTEQWLGRPTESRPKTISTGNLTTHPPCPQKVDEFFCWWDSSLAMILLLTWRISKENDMSLFNGCKKSINELKRQKWRRRWKGDEHREPAM